MNALKLQKLLVMARNRPAPEPTADFAAQVLRLIQREGGRAPLSLFDQLSLLFPRIAFAALLLIGLSVALDFGASVLGQPVLRSAFCARIRATMGCWWIAPRSHLIKPVQNI